jgi:hypothetical protein
MEAKMSMKKQQLNEGMWNILEQGLWRMIKELEEHGAVSALQDVNVGEEISENGERDIFIHLTFENNEEGGKE